MEPGLTLMFHQISVQMDGLTDVDTSSVSSNYALYYHWLQHI